MSQIVDSLESRIRELTEFIKTKRSELAAYELILQTESVNDGRPVMALPAKPATAPPIKAAAPASSNSPVTYQGNKTAFVFDVVKSFGSKGATPKEVDQVFESHKVERGKNTIYDALSYMVSRKRLRRRDGRYFAGTSAPAAAGPEAVQRKSAPTKRKLSPEGRKRIVDAMKKRWAAKRAAARKAA